MPNEIPDLTNPSAELHADADARIVALTAERDEAVAALVERDAEIVTLKDDLAAQTELAKPVQVQLAAAIARHGINPKAVAHMPQGEHKLTATEKCQAVRGY